MPKGVSYNPKGRTKGVPNKVSRSLKELAGRHTAACIEQLVRITQNSKIENNRLAAIEQLLNRAHGKPSQAVTGDPDMPVELRITWLPNQEK